jgi:surfactin family lipopeptide synthetase A
VKLRGFRIELGEIEFLLAQHPLVRETVVVVRQETPDEVRLVAYVVSRIGTTASTAELFNFLKQVLPDYMVPAAFVWLDAIPLTANGKIDRKALPAPDTTRPELAGVHVAPRTPIEQQIAEIWAQVLRLEQVGIYDNFFELGGHSLLATQVITRLRQAEAIELPLRTFFEAPTVAGLADRVETLRWAIQGGQNIQDNSTYEEGEL